MTSITAERALYREVGFEHRLRSEWGARFTKYGEARPVDEPARYQFVHITVTNPSTYSSNDAHARGIEAIGISRFPNTGISYNELVLPGGKLYEAQPMGRRGAHTVNDDQRATCDTPGCPSRGTSVAAPSFNLNVNARAIALARNVDDPVTDADVDAIARWCAAGRLAGMVRTDARIHGHRCVSGKDCPGSKAWALMADIRDLTADYVREGLSMAVTEADRTFIWAEDAKSPISGQPTNVKSLLSAGRKDAYDAEQKASEAVTKIDALAVTVAAQADKLTVLEAAAVAQAVKLDEILAAVQGVQQAAETGAETGAREGVQAGVDIRVGVTDNES